MSETTSMKGTWTETGMSKLNGYAAGEPLTLRDFAVGDGNGSVPVVSSSQTGLVNEVWRGQVNSVMKNPDNPQEVVVDVVLPFNTGDFWIREWGLFDESGNLVAVGPHAEFYKPVLASGQAAEITERITLPVSQEAAISLTISSQALATQKFVDAQIAGHDSAKDAHEELMAALKLLINAGKLAPGTPGTWLHTDEAEQIVWAEMASQSKYDLCEFYYFRHPTLKQGFMPAQGGLISDAAALYPEAWEYLLSPEGQVLCKTEAEWQAMTTAVWATLADGTKVGWNGIGGAPYYAPNLDTGALRLPDLRGMYAEAAGFDGLGVGGVHGDAIRNITGIVGGVQPDQTMPFYQDNTNIYAYFTPTPSGYGIIRTRMNIAKVVPTANKNQPRAWGALACVYLGRHAS